MSEGVRRHTIVSERYDRYALQNPDRNTGYILDGMAVACQGSHGNLFLPLQVLACCTLRALLGILNKIDSSTPHLLDFSVTGTITTICVEKLP